MEAEPVQPALWILQSCEHIAPRKTFIMRGVAIGSEAGQDELSFNGRNEGCGVWVVLDEEKRGKGHNDGGETLLYSLVSSQVEACNYPW